MIYRKNLIRPLTKEEIDANFKELSDAIASLQTVVNSLSGLNVDQIDQMYLDFTDIKDAYQALVDSSPDSEAIASLQTSVTALETSLAEKANMSDVYSKEEINSLIANITNGQDGNGIVSIEKTSTSGLIDTYTITFTDNTTTTFQVTNGQDETGSTIDAYTKTESNSLIDALKDVPVNVKTAVHTLELVDRATAISTGYDVTVPLNSAVAFPVGSIITITNTSTAVITIIAIEGVTIRLVGTADIGNRTLSSYGQATIHKNDTDTWYISGAGLS